MIMNLRASPTTGFDELVAVQNEMSHATLNFSAEDVTFPAHDFRMRRLFKYAERSYPDDKFHRLISFQNEVSHATFNVEVDWCTMISLSCRHRDYLWDLFGLTPNDILVLVFDVKAVIAEF